MKQERRGCGSCNQLGNIGSGPGDENETVGSKREGEKEEVRCKVLVRQKEPRLSETTI